MSTCWASAAEASSFVQTLGERLVLRGELLHGHPERHLNVLAVDVLVVAATQDGVEVFGDESEAVLRAVVLEVVRHDRNGLDLLEDVRHVDRLDVLLERARQGDGELRRSRR